MLSIGGRIRAKATCLVAILFPFFGGCGTTVPLMNEVTDSAQPGLDAGGALELNIKTQIYCELRGAVMSVTDPREGNPFYVGGFRKLNATPGLPDDWGVEMTLTLQVDENTALNPSVAWTNPSPFGPNSSFNLGLAATASSAATRIDKFVSFYMVGDLKRDLGAADRCFYDETTGARRDLKLPGSSLLLASDLNITRWLYDALIVQNTYKSEATDPSKKDDVYSYDARFVVVTNASANPAWKLVKIANNQSGQPLLGAGRSRSHDLLLTFGPTEKPKEKGGPRTFTTTATNADLASQIGNSVTNGIRNLQVMP